MARPVLTGNHNNQVFAATPFAYLSGSFRGATFGNLGGQGSPGIDAVNCDFTNAKFNGTVKDFMSRGCIYTGATLPLVIPSYCHDMIWERIKRGYAAATTAQKTQWATIYNDIVARLGGANPYIHSWRDAARVLHNTYGEAQMRQFRQLIVASAVDSLRIWAETNLEAMRSTEPGGQTWPS